MKGKSIQDLREAFKAKADAAKKLYDETPADGWTDEVKAQFDKLTAEAKNLDAQIDACLQADALIASTKEAEYKATGIQVGADREAERPFKSFGEQLHAIWKAGPQQEHSPGADKRLLRINATAGTGNKESVSEEGGFLVQQDFATELTSLADDDTNAVLLNAATKRTISSASNSLKINGLDETSRATGSRYGGVRVYTTAELEQMTESRPKFNKIELKLDKLTGLYYASDEELEDVSYLEGEVTDLFQREFAFKTQDLIYEGSGAGAPLGILNADCTISVAKETGQAADTITRENINKMWARMPAGMRGEAMFIANQDTEPALEEMTHAVGTGGVPVYMPPGGISEAPYARLKGRPVYFIEQCATLGDTGDIMLVAMSAYIWATKGGIQAASSIHLKFDYNQTVFRWTVRVDGQPRYKSALTPFKGSSTVSPFVKLNARA